MVCTPNSRLKTSCLKGGAESDHHVAPGTIPLKTLGKGTVGLRNVGLPGGWRVDMSTGLDEDGYGWMDDAGAEGCDKCKVPGAVMCLMRSIRSAIARRQRHGPTKPPKRRPALDGSIARGWFVVKPFALTGRQPPHGHVCRQHLRRYAADKPRR